MIGQFNRGDQFAPKQSIAIFETIPLHDSEIGLYATPEQTWEIDGYDETAQTYILVCKELGIAVKLKLEDLLGLFEEKSPVEEVENE